MTPYWAAFHQKRTARRVRELMAASCSEDTELRHEVLEALKGQLDAELVAELW